MSTTTAVEKRSGLLLPVLFTLTAFFGAGLIFMVQPLVSKLLLPAYGGSAAVWTTSSFFFQVILLLGYIFVHATVRVGRGKQPLFQIPLVLLALAFLPLALPENAVPGDQSPAVWLVRTLLVMVALPFMVLSTTGPLLQKWYSWTNGPRSQDPYFIYAASNAGSFIGLLSYPFIIEPNLTLSAQRQAWSWAFGFFLLLVVLCAVALYRRPAEDVAEVKLEAVAPLSWREQARWVFLAFLPSSLMLGVTTHVATDVASVPLLWVVPLAIYLATMVGAFARTSRSIPSLLPYFAVLPAVLSLVLTFSPLTLSAKVTAIVLFASLGAIALVAHLMLAAGRPEPKYLTRFFVLVSFGGALGGLFNSLIAPLIFPRPFEFAVALAVTPFLVLSLPEVRRWAVYACVAGLLFSIAVRDAQGNPDVLERSRTFYGSYAVKGNPLVHGFIHGTTVHGIQYFETPEIERTPTTYYVEEGPLGDLFDLKFNENITAVGLGAGTIAAYGKPGMAMRFVEIDPEVVRIARDSGAFTFLKNSEADITIETADGRLALEALPDASQDLIVLDAFSSDSIPVHMLTEEALAMYRSKLAPNGMLAIHISNRVFDLAPVVAGGAESLGLKPYLRTVSQEDVQPYGVGQAWMVIPTSDEDGEALESRGWADKSDLDPIRWTDDYSSILDVLY